MTTVGRVLVTGATGNTGGALIPMLQARGVAVTAASRHPVADPGTTSVRFDWYDPGTFDEALTGVDHIYLVPPPLDPEPVAVMEPFLSRAREKGVRRVVLLSASVIEAGGPGAGKVHALLPETFPEWAVLRPSWFMQNFIGAHPHAESIRTSNVITTATGEGRVGFVDVGDIARVATHALVSEAVPGGDLILTGPETLSYSDVAALLTELLGRPITHQPVSQQTLRELLSSQMNPQAAALLAAVDGAIAAGAEDRTTDVVESVTGKPPRSLREVIESALDRTM
jgi:uncharacterized protein YbjT (DUF2867 family)